MNTLPRSVLNTLHLSLSKKKYDRGAFVCREGDDSEQIFIICKGEFEVVKTIDVHAAD